MSERMFYFSRRVGSDMLSERYLVSGVVLAHDEAAAREKLDALLKAYKNPDRAENFDFCDLAAVPAPDHGVIAIAMASQ